MRRHARRRRLRVAIGERHLRVRAVANDNVVVTCRTQATYAWAGQSQPCARPGAAAAGLTQAATPRVGVSVTVRYSARRSERSTCRLTRRIATSSARDQHADVGPSARRSRGRYLFYYLSIEVLPFSRQAAPGFRLAGHLAGPPEVHEHPADHIAAHSRAGALEVSQGEVAWERVKPSGL